MTSSFHFGIIISMTVDDLIRLDNRIFTKDGSILYSSNALLELLYNGKIPQEILFDNNDCDIKAFNDNSYKNFDEIYYTLPSKIKTIEERKNTWFYPKEYDDIDLDKLFFEMTKNMSKEYQERAILELKMFRERNMEKFLRFCVHLSVIISENDIVVGIGRGSSCACLLLYLMKIHMVDPIKYGLDIKEFLK